MKERYLLDIKKIINNNSFKFLVVRSVLQLVLFYQKGIHQAEPKFIFFGSFAFAFLFMESLVNIFGLDYGAHFLRYLSPKSILDTIVKNYFLLGFIQIMFAVFYLSFSLFIFKFPNQLLILQAGLLLGVIVTSSYWGVISSIFYPIAIPFNLKNKIQRTNPGVGLTMGSIIVVLVLIILGYTYTQSPDKLKWLEVIAITVGLLLLVFPLYVRAFKKSIFKNRFSTYSCLTNKNEG